MKLLMVLNENPAGSHPDVHSALRDLVADGRSKLSDYQVYPFLERLKNGARDQIAGEIAQIVDGFQPDGIIWSHTTEIAYDDLPIDYVKASVPRPAMAYVDGDMYQRWYKPLPKETLRIVEACDVSFWPGQNTLINGLRSRRHMDVRYAPGTTCPHRFGSKERLTPEYDVIMIGNVVSGRLGIRTFPGSKWRIQLAKHLEKKLGNRLALFGNGWRGSCAKGPVPFEEQDRYMQMGRIAVGVNNLSADYYFSNRLPISMSSGVLMLYNWENGYDSIFDHEDKQYFFTSTEQAWAKCEKLLDADQESIDQVARRRRLFANERLSMKAKLDYIINVLISYRLGGGRAERLKEVRNPWLQGGCG